MKTTHVRVVALSATLALAAALTLPAMNATSTAAPAPGSVGTLPTNRPLNILLSDDDGWNALGITAVYDKLTAAGHHVTISAPATDQSGVSAKVSFYGNLSVIEQEPNKYSVSDSPVTSTIYGMEELFIKQKGYQPDLVVSGTNVGANTGFDTNFSGTVGNATVASGMYGVPAIAISTDYTYPDKNTGAYDETADLLVDMIDQGIPKLSRGEFLNVNYPILSGTLTKPKGIRYASNSPASAAAFSFTQVAGNDWTIVPARGTEVSPAGSDIALLGQGYVTIGVLKADRSVPTTEVPGVSSLIRRLTGQPEPSTPKPPVVKPTVEKLPKKVLAKTSQWLKATGTAGTAVRVTWKPTGKKAKRLKTVKVGSSVAGGVIRFKAPRKGTYQVTVTSGATKLRAGKVRVL